MATESLLQLEEEPRSFARRLLMALAPTALVGIPALINALS
jgi:hypothetical protein